ncbi:WD repeat-containing protein 70 [Chamberlinius hualienensis]
MEDDVEEMSSLRAMRGKNQKSKWKPITSTSKTVEKNEEETELLTDNKEMDDMSKLMGFSGFGKKAKTFDLDNIFEKTRRSAVERSAQNLEKAAIDEERQKEEAEQNEASDDDDFIGPPVPTAEEEEVAEKSQDDDPLVTSLPISHEIVLQHGSRTVSALTLDPSGSRLITGGYDYDVRFWDFAGMDNSFQSFRTIQPCESHAIKNLQYSNNGDSVLVISGNSQAKILNRDGYEIFECVKGDQYITDMANTKGHVAMLNSGCWHPTDKNEFMTCSNDGTARLWSAKDSKKHKNLIKPRTQGGLRAIPNTCTYSRDGNLVACACKDGSIQMWDHRRAFVNTCHLLRNVHQPGTDTSCISFANVAQMFSTRGGDDTLKLWDLKMLKKPVAEVNGLFNRFPETDCTFSPDDKLIVTGTSLNKGEKYGKLIFFHAATLTKATEIPIVSSSVIRCLWHPRLNQIITGCGNGEVKVHYSPSTSDRGAKLCVVKVKKRAAAFELLSERQIITPHALPLFREERPKSTRKRMEKDRKDPIKSRRPDLPVTGPGQGGRLAAAGGTLSSYIIRNLGLKKRVEDDQDPREAILKFAKDAAENPYWIAPAYTKTQPKAVFHTAEGGDEEPEAKKTKQQ